VPRARRSS